MLPRMCSLALGMVVSGASGRCGIGKEFVLLLSIVSAKPGPQWVKVRLNAQKSCRKSNPWPTAIFQLYVLIRTEPSNQYVLRVKSLN